MVPHARDPHPHDPLMPGHALDTPASFELIEAAPVQLDAPVARQQNNSSSYTKKGHHKICHTIKSSETSITEPLLAAVSSSSSSEEEINEVTEPCSDNDDVEISLVEKLPEPEEASWQIALQVFFPYIVAGLGMVAAGMLLDVVQVSHSWLSSHEDV